MTPPDAESPIPSGKPKERTCSKPIWARALAAKRNTKPAATEYARRRIRRAGGVVVWQEQRSLRAFVALLLTVKMKVPADILGMDEWVSEPAFPVKPKLQPIVNRLLRIRLNSRNSR